MAERQAEVERIQAALVEKQRDQPRFVFVQPRVELAPRTSAARGASVGHGSDGRHPRGGAGADQPAAIFAWQHAGVRGAVAATGAAAGGPEPGSAHAAGAACAAETRRGPPIPARPPMRCACPTAGRRRPISATRRAAAPPRPSPLSQALKNLSRYAEQAAFENPNGGQNNAFGPAIQFDTKGVEFGPWIRRFIAQVKRNWFVPYAAMSLKGHVVITFNVHKSGALTDFTVIGPSSWTPSTTRRSTPWRRAIPPSRCRSSTRPTKRSSPSLSTTTNRRPRSSDADAEPAGRPGRVACRADGVRVLAGDVLISSSHVGTITKARRREGTKTKLRRFGRQRAAARSGEAQQSPKSAKSADPSAAAR